MNTTTLNTSFYGSILFPHLNNDNVLIYNGELLPDGIKDSVTRSVENLMNHSRTIYVSKIYRSPHCIWYILVKNILDIYIISSLKNSLSIAQNNRVLKDALNAYPSILFNMNISYDGFYPLNLLQNIGYYLGIAEDVESNDTFDLLA
jgi:hypothetical protein